MHVFKYSFSCSIGNNQQSQCILSSVNHIICLSIVNGSVLCGCHISRPKIKRIASRSQYSKIEKKEKRINLEIKRKIYVILASGKRLEECHHHCFERLVNRCSNQG